MNRFSRFFIKTISLVTLRSPNVVRQLDGSGKAMVTMHAFFIPLMLCVFYFAYQPMLGPTAAALYSVVIICADLLIGRILERRYWLKREGQPLDSSALHRWRVAACLTIAAATGYGVMLSKNSDEIDRRSAVLLAQELAPLREELKAYEAQLRADHIEFLVADLDAKSAAVAPLEEAFVTASNEVQSNEKDQLFHRQEAIRELGGVGRDAGDGRLYRAALASEKLEVGRSVGLLERQSQARDAVFKARNEVIVAKNALDTKLRWVQEQVEAKFSEIKLDPRWRDEVSTGFIQRTLSVLSLMHDDWSTFAALMIQLLAVMVIFIFIETLLLSFNLATAMMGAGIDERHFLYERLEANHYADSLDVMAEARANWLKRQRNAIRAAHAKAEAEDASNQAPDPSAGERKATGKVLVLHRSTPPKPGA
jgi:hypothetical protein